MAVTAAVIDRRVDSLRNDLRMGVGGKAKSAVALG